MVTEVDTFLTKETTSNTQIFLIQESFLIYSKNSDCLFSALSSFQPAGWTMGEAFNLPSQCR